MTACVMATASLVCPGPAMPPGAQPVCCIPCSVGLRFHGCSSHLSLLLSRAPTSLVSALAADFPGLGSWGHATEMAASLADL